MLAGKEQSPPIRTERVGQVGRIVLNRGEVLNPLSPDLVDACLQAIERFADDAVPVVEFTGSGRAFCAGADLEWIRRSLGEAGATSSQRYDAMLQGLGDSQQLIHAIRDYPGLTVASMNGPAVGGGAGLALAFDITLAARNAYFGLPFVSVLGLVPDLGAIQFMQERMGPAKTLGYALLGDRLSAEQAARDGLIWACCDDDELRARTDELTRQLSALPGSAALAVKKLVRRSIQCELGDFLEEECRSQAELFASEDALRAITKFLDQRSSR